VANAPDDPTSDPIEIDTSVAHAARMYDYLLGGTTNFDVDREAAIRQAEASGGLANARYGVQAIRDFLGRSLRLLAGELGVRQFLDLGTGIPSENNLNGLARATNAESRIVYVDDDPIVLAHAHALLAGTPEGQTDFLQADLREPEVILGKAARIIDFDEPVAVILMSMLHYIGDDEDPGGIVDALMAGVPPGSYLLLSHLSTDIQERMAGLVRSAAENPNAGYRFVMRSHAEILGYFHGLELVEPGLVPDVYPPGVQKPPSYGGLARKP
jgi:S-adenosyl methyltransferase